MPPGEEDEEELIDDIEVGDVEVVLERGYVDVTTNLRIKASQQLASDESFSHRTNSAPQRGHIDARSAPRIPGRV